MKMNMLITWTSYGKLIIFFSRSCFYLNQLAYHPERTIHKMKSLCHLVYRYIFCLLSRRSGQITVRALEIVYSFCSFGCSSSSFVWQHSPLSSFSFECVPQHFFGSIGTFHIPLSHLQWLLLNHTYTSDMDIYLAYQSGFAQNNGRDNYKFYI